MKTDKIVRPKRVSPLPAVPNLIILSFLVTFSSFSLGAEAQDAKPLTTGQAASKISILFAESSNLLKENRPYEARQLLEQIVQMAPNLPSAHCNLGLAFERSGNLTEALAEFKKALALDPRLSEALLNSGSCYQAQGNNVLAVRFYERYLQENPHSPYFDRISDTVTRLKASGFEEVGSTDQGDYFNKSEHLRWMKDRLPIKVFIDDSKDQPGYRDAYKTALSSAFDAWCEASKGQLSWVAVDSKDKADIYCFWTNDLNSPQGPATERGCAKLIVRDHYVQRAQISLLTTPILEGTPLSDDDMEKACLHEVGHALGIKGHSPNNHDVMFFTIDTPTVWPVLSRRDRATINRLYSDDI